MTDDQTLLRQYEPILRYTHGEHFYPFDVERYVARSALWKRPPRTAAQEIVPHGGLRLNRLSGPVTGDHDSLYFLQFVEPLSGRALQRVLSRRERPRFRARGRLARVGLFSRIVDALFTATLLLRGTVPGGTAAAAEDTYQTLLAGDERYTYYGRVVREEGYVILHYLFFYCMNDWRSSFHGVNDHEGDWEQVFVYLEACEQQPLRPAWVAYAAHDYAGDDLRRRWDDPELEKEGQHPVIYVGAGSHSSYFTRGEYIITVSLDAFRRIIRVLEALQYFWRVTLRQGSASEPESDITRLFRIPFVDYARGDGLTIGPGGDKAWSPVLLDPIPNWITDYRGLWGFDARDPVAGENAPAGPKFNRDGTIRRSWHNPLGWAGLQKVEPPGCQADLLREQITFLIGEQAKDHATVKLLRDKLARRYAEYQALDGRAYLNEATDAAWIKIEELETRLNHVCDTIAEREDIIDACQARLTAIETGDPGPPRQHIRHFREPQSEAEIEMSSLAESWAAFSVGLLLVGFVVLYLTAEQWWLGLGALLLIFAAIEAVFRGEIETVIVSTTLTLSVIASLLLIYEFFWSIVIVLVMTTGLLIIVDNVRELRS